MTESLKMEQGPESQELMDSLQKVRAGLEVLKDPNQVSSLSELNNMEDLHSMGVCFNVIRRTVAPAFKGIEDGLNEILKMKPELHQEVDALITNSWIGYMAHIDSETNDLYEAGAVGLKGAENGKTKEAFTLIKRLAEIMPVALESTETFLNSLEQK